MDGSGSGQHGGGAAAHACACAVGSCDFRIAAHCHKHRETGGVAAYGHFAAGHIVDIEIAAVHNPGSVARETFRRRFHGIRKTVVDGFGSLRGVQLPRPAVDIDTAVVVDAVGDVARLLHFGHESARTYGMQRAGRNEIELSRLRLMHSYALHDGAVGGTPWIFLTREGRLQAAVYAAARTRVHYVPHLRLAGRGVPLRSKRIAGMHLHREVALRVDEFYQQRKRVAAEACGRLRADEVRTITPHQFYDVYAGKRAFGHHAFVARHSRYFPAFADGIDVDTFSFEAAYGIASPYHGLIIGSENYGSGQFCYHFFLS